MQELYKLLIADDEFVIRDGLMAFHWETLGFTVVGGASNGQEALDLMVRTPADLVITDIRMPVVDGLELSRTIQQKYPHTKILILTGYKDFAYAQRAIRAGVVEYILKPADLHELEKLTMKIKNQLDAERSRKETLRSYRQKLQNSLPMATQSFLRGLFLDPPMCMDEVEEILDHLEIYLGRRFYACAVMECRTPNSKRLPIPSQCEQKLAHYLKANDLGYCYTDQSLTVLLLNFDAVDSPARPRTIVRDIVSEAIGLLRGAAEEPPCTVHAGVSCIFRHISHASTAYRQANRQLNRHFFGQDQPVLFAWDDQSTPGEQCFNYPYEQEDGVMDAVFDGDARRVSEALDALWAELHKDISFLAPPQLQSIVAQLLNTMERRLAKHDVSLKAITGATPPFLAYVEAIPTLSSLEEAVRGIALQAAEYVRRLNEKEGSTAHLAIDRAEKFIRAHYNERITLNAVAETVFLNPSYLSIQFKKETGKSFTEFLKAQRIEKAKELIRNTEQKAYEVGEAVGYRDYKYFSEIFKAVTGFSPKEYKQRHVVR